MGVSGSIYIYKDRGVSLTGLQQLIQSISRLTHQPIVTLSASEVCSGSWQKNAHCIILPGGEDLPYGEQLNGKGNAIIRDYVENGGLFLGLCAGAYYASRRILFNQNHPEEICAKRELGFFPGTVVGPHWAPYVKDHHCGARAVKIHSADYFNIPPWYTYINGGGKLVVDPGCEPDVHLLAWDDEGNGVIAGMNVGRGIAYVSSAHWEYNPYQLVSCCWRDRRGCWDISDYHLWLVDYPHQWAFSQRFWDHMMERRCSQ